MLNEDPIVDGFCYAGRLMDSPYLYQAGSVANLEALRLAGGYVPRIYAAPDITAPPLGNFANTTQQLRLVEGTYVWAISLGCYINDNIGPPFTFDRNFPATNQYFIDVRDEATGVPIFSDWVSESDLFVPVEDFGLVRNFFSYLAPFPLSNPRPIMNPGVVTIQISNSQSNSAASVQPQVVLYCAEPCNTGFIPNTCE